VPEADFILMFEYGSIDCPALARDNLARAALNRFRDAVNWQSRESLGRNRSLRTVLRECYDQANGAQDPADVERAAHLGVNAVVSLTAMKGGLAHAFLKQSLVSDELAWALSPTPRPDLSASARLEVLRKVKELLFPVDELPTPEVLIPAIKKLKAEARQAEFEYAEMAARRMETLMLDQCVEGNWRRAMDGLLTGMIYYPYGVIHGPRPVRRPRLVWKGDRVRVRKEVYYRWDAVSPWDFWYSPDSRTPQDGTGVFIRERMTRRDLLYMLEMKGYFSDQVKEVLEEAETSGKFAFHWMSENPDQVERHLTHWIKCGGTIDAMTHYGFFSGRELSEYGVGGLEDRKFYDATMTIVAGRTIQVYVAPDPTVNVRPVFAASFYAVRDRIANYGIAQRLRDVERIYAITLQYLVRNMANSSLPVTEFDVARVAEAELNREDLASVEPGMTIPVKPDIAGPDRPVYRFHTIPSSVVTFKGILDYLMELAHLVTNIPASLHGTAVGTGANRTYRGMANLQNNALQAMQDAVANMDETIFLPMGELLYAYNMLYEDDDLVKGDCKIRAQGVQGLLARELQRNNALELLQLVGSVGAQLGDSAVPLIDWAFQQVLTGMKVPADVAAKASFGGAAQQPVLSEQAATPQQPVPPEQAAMQQAAMPPQQGGPVL
jgi:hypothetical protein